MDYILGSTLGGLLAFLFSIPAIVMEWVERGRVQDAPLLVDVKIIFGARLKKSEVF